VGYNRGKVNGKDNAMRKKNIHVMVTTGLVLSAWIVSTGAVFAQFGGTRNSWFPQNNPSALSPWLEMQRVSTSELDSYNQYVRPRLELERVMMAQQRETNRQMDQQRMMQKELSQVRDYQQRQDYRLMTGASPTGKGAGYGNYLHFYPQRRR
jgi:hypothetical protein